VWTYPQSGDPNRKTGLIVDLKGDVVPRGEAGRCRQPLFPKAEQCAIVQRMRRELQSVREFATR
jgi:hypothetical protein